MRVDRGVRILATLLSVVAAGCATGTQEPAGPVDLTELGTRYAAAWSGQDPDALASFYAEDGSLRVNDGEPAVGRAAIAAKAAGFMTAFPDMLVTMDSITGDGDRATFHWTWTGTNTGPGGTGRAVRIQGFEQWTLRPDGTIVVSRGHYDEDEYRRQVGETGPREDG